MNNKKSKYIVIPFITLIIGIFTINAMNKDK